jgi:hypothetical protein
MRLLDSTQLSFAALALLVASGCEPGSCSPAAISWWAPVWPMATRNAAGQPTIEIAGRPVDGGCDEIGGSTLIEVVPLDVIIRERGADEDVPGPGAEWVDADAWYAYEEDGVFVDITTGEFRTVEIGGEYVERSLVTIEIHRGSGEVTVVECDSATPEGVPICAEP